MKMMRRHYIILGLLTFTLKTASQNTCTSTVRHTGTIHTCRPYCRNVASYDADVTCPNITSTKLGSGYRRIVTSTNNDLYLQQITTMKFLDSFLQEVPVGLIVYNTIIKLYINNSHVDSIQPAAFSNLVNLNELYLQDNNITKLSAETFSGLNQIGILNLSSNRLSEIHEDLFFSLSKLENLQLQNNEINYIPAGTFRDLVSLKILNLGSNMIDQLEVGSFEGLYNLENLDITKNKLLDLKVTTLYPVRSIRTLGIDSNLLKILDVQSFIAHHKPPIHNDKFEYRISINMTSNINDWRCEWLLNTIHELYKNGFNVTRGIFFKGSNVNGFPCIDTSKGNKIENVSAYTAKLLVTTFLKNILPTQSTTNLKPISEWRNVKSTTNIPKLELESLSSSPVSDEKISPNIPPQIFKEFLTRLSQIRNLPITDESNKTDQKLVKCTEESRSLLVLMLFLLTFLTLAQLFILYNKYFSKRSKKSESLVQQDAPSCNLQLIHSSEQCTD